MYDDGGGGRVAFDPYRELRALTDMTKARELTFGLSPSDSCSIRPLLVASVLALVPTATACDDLFGPDHRFSYDEIQYYTDVAIGFEYGEPSPYVHKWTDTIVVHVSGNPGQADRQELSRVIAELNALRDGPDITTTANKESSNFRVHFAPESTFADLLHQYVPGNKGFFSLLTNEHEEITQAAVLIDNTDAISQMVRDHLIREEVTQSLGLARDPPEYPESIFGPGGNTPTEYAPIDRAVIRIHDLPEIRSGMTEDSVWEVLR